MIQTNLQRQPFILSVIGKEELKLKDTRKMELRQKSFIFELQPWDRNRIHTFFQTILSVFCFVFVFFEKEVCGERSESILTSLSLSWFIYFLLPCILFFYSSFFLSPTAFLLFFSLPVSVSFFHTLSPESPPNVDPPCLYF